MFESTSNDIDKKNLRVSLVGERTAVNAYVMAAHAFLNQESSKLVAAEKPKTD